MCDCNFLCKILCTLILIIAFIFNTIGNWVGAGDIIPTDKCLFGYTCHETTAEEPSTELTAEYTTQPSATTTTATKPAVTAVPTSMTETTATTESSTATTAKPTAATTSAKPTIATTATTKITTTRTTTTTTQKNTPDENTKVTFYGKTFNYTFYSIQATSDGGYVACGSMSISGASQPFAVKFDKESAVVWEKTFTSSTSTLHFESLAVLDNGTVIIAGYGYITDSNEVKTKGTSEALIYALSESDGTVLFSKAYDGSKADVFNAVAPTADGFIAGGETDSTDGDFAGSAGNSAVLISFDSEGNPIWKKYLTGSKSGSVEDIATDSSGNIFVSYLTSSTDGDFANCEELMGGYIDTVIMKYDKNGTYKWDYVIATSGRDEFTEIAADGSGGCVVAGYYELIGAVIPNGTLDGIYNLGGIDSVIFYINSNGSLKWKRTLAGINDDYITDISKSSKGFAISGYTASGNRDFASIGNVGGLDGFACMVNSSGTVTAMYSQAGTGEDAATCIAARTNNGKFMVAGRTKSADGNFEANANKTTIYTGYIASYAVG